MFLIVKDKMLGTCHCAGALDADDGFVGSFSGQIGFWSPTDIGSVETLQR